MINYFSLNSARSIYFMCNEKEPLVSILMNCYNGEIYLKEAIDSIYNQTYQNWEIIFVDDCSDDKSADIARSYDSRLKYYRLDEKIPLGPARDWGLKFVKGKYLAFLDVDDLWIPTKLHMQVEVLEKNPDAVFCYAGGYFINEKSEIIGKKLPKSKSGYVFPSLLKKYDVNQLTVLIRFNKAYCFYDRNFYYSPDYGLFMRVASQYNAIVLDQYLVKCRLRSNSLTSKTIDRWWIEQKSTLDAILTRNNSLKQKYPKEFELAYAKVSYYKALYQYYIEQDKQARLEMKSIRFKNISYFMLYLLSLMPFDLWRIVHRRLGKVAYK